MTREDYIKEAEKQGIPNIILSNGDINAYRAEQIKFRAGSMQEKTFDKTIGKRGGHTCCGSKVCWRHKVSCPGLKEWGTL